MTKPPWLQKVEAKHTHMKAFLAPPVPQGALRNMDMVLDQFNKAYEVLGKIKNYIDNSKTGNTTIEGWVIEALEAINNPEVKHD